MSLELDQLTNGLAPDNDLFFPEQPADPEMRESTSIWLGVTTDRGTSSGFGNILASGLCGMALTISAVCCS